MSLKALTANTAPEENAHILAEDDAAIFQSMFGDDGVLEIGQQMKVTVISNNKVRVADGVVCIGGHIARTVYGDYTDLTIENGESGKNRNDLIIGAFSTTGAGGIDTMQLAVKKGTAGTAATDPALTQGNLYAGSKLREVPLWRVKIEGLSITKVEQLFEIVPSIPTLKKELESLNGKITEQNTLWDGFLYMQGGQEVKLSTPIDQTKSGIVLVWSFVENEKAQDYAWHSCFVPKALVESRPGDGHQFNLFWNTWSQKYLYIHNDKIVGQTTNSNTQNKRFGLRKIIAV
ncbi:MAG: hypothetical protein ACLVFI_08835 [Christensenellales bacterium]